MKNIIKAIVGFIKGLFRGTEETVDDIMSNFVTVRNKLDDKAAKEEKRGQTLKSMADELVFEADKAHEEKVKAIKIRASLDQLLKV